MLGEKEKEAERKERKSGRFEKWKGGEKSLF